MSLEYFGCDVYWCLWLVWLGAEPVVRPPEQRRHGHGGSVVVVIVAPAATFVVGDRDGPRLGAAMVDETLHQAEVATNLVTERGSGLLGPNDLSHVHAPI